MSRLPFGDTLPYKPTLRVAWAEPPSDQMTRAKRQKGPKPDKLHWVTADKRRIRISAMENSHLVNTMRMLRRNAPKAKQEEMASLLLLSMRLQGDHANDMIEDEMLKLEAMSIDDYIAAAFPCWPAMLRRAERRGLAEKAEDTRPPAVILEEDIERKMEAELAACLDDGWGNS